MREMTKHSIGGRATRRGRHAFTLVEVTLSLGVVSIGLVGILALFPLGYRGTRMATDDTQMAMIAQDYAVYYSQLVQTSTNYDVNPGVGLLPAEDYSNMVTNDGTIYSVHVVVANSGFAQLTTAGGTNLLSRVHVHISRPGSRTNTYVTDVGRYVLP